VSDVSPELEIRHVRVGRNGTLELTAKDEGEVVHVDLVEIARAADRERFAEALCRALHGIDRRVVDAKLLEIHAGYGAGGAYGAAPKVHGDPDESPIVARKWPDSPGEAAWHGPAGRLARDVGPYTEADPVGILAQLLVGFGNLIGRNAHFNVNATRHYTNLNCCTAGPTGAGRKGTSWDIARVALAQIDPAWADGRITGGLVSGEGLIWEVRDRVVVDQEVREKGQPSRIERVPKDAGICDKRLMVVETEMGGLLKVLTREGNNLSALIRQAWDSGHLRSMAKNNPNRATDAHVSIVGHITEAELTRYLSQVDAANGFANRFLWLAVRQSRFLPDGAAFPIDLVRPILDAMIEAAAFAREPRRVERDAQASELWHRVYPDLCRGRPGLLGSMLGRAVPQVMRLATVYALLDRSGVVGREHLEAALALWDYCERSAAFIFGETLGDRDADALLDALRASPSGLTRARIRSEVFGRHKSSEEIGRILGRLLEANLVESEEVETGGRPATIWKPRGAPKAPYAPEAPVGIAPHYPSGAYGAYGASRHDESRSPEENQDPAPKAPYAPNPDGQGYGANGAYGAPPPLEEREVGEL
jgi:hypothetical protein